MAHDYFQRRNGDICTQVFLASNLPNAVALREEYVRGCALPVHLDLSESARLTGGW